MMPPPSSAGRACSPDAIGPLTVDAELRDVVTHRAMHRPRDPGIYRAPHIVVRKGFSRAPVAGLCRVRRGVHRRPVRSRRTASGRGRSESRCGCAELVAGPVLVFHDLELVGSRAGTDPPERDSIAPDSDHRERLAARHPAGGIGCRSGRKRMAGTAGTTPCSRPTTCGRPKST